MKGSPDQGTQLDVKAMMENARRQIALKKKQLGEVRVPSPSVQTSSNVANRIDQLKAQIESRVIKKVPEFVRFLSDPSRPSPSVGAAPLILDADGKTRDAMGREVKLPTFQPMSLVNIRKVKQDKFEQITSEVKEEPQGSSFYDDRIMLKPASRPKKALKLVEEGRYEQQGEKLRAKQRLEKLQSEISSVSKKTGIQSATALALLVPKKDDTKGGTPDIEWWDSLLVESYDKVDEARGITNLVEHPLQMKPPTDPCKAKVLPIFLTKKERQKLRRRCRREAQTEKMERVRLGLDPPPEPKVKLSNMMRVLGQHQVQDPTKIEAQVRQQMAKRQKAHEEANATRKLTDEQRKEKKIRKIQEDTSLRVHVALYRVLSLLPQSKRFKVETNAKQLHMTGCVLIFKNSNLVVVEGGPKQQNKFKRLMTSRIKWEEDLVSKDGTNQEEKVSNQCVLVWEGEVKTRSFGEIRVKLVQNEIQARELFKKHSVEHYWDIGYKTAVLASL